MNKLKVGIIGCGGIANGKHMPSIQAAGFADMVAFCDIIPERAKESAEKFGVKGAKVFEDFNEMLKLDLDAVHVCTPNSSHAPITIAALNAGCHVLCEKPMAMNYAEATAMCDAAKKNGKALTIGYQRRQFKASQYLKKLIDEGDLGDIYFAKAPALRRRGVPTWGVFLDEEKQGGGPLIDIGTHVLDLTLWFMDNYQPETVCGSVYRKLADTKNAANEWGPWDPAQYTVEDSAFGYIKMKNGATIMLETSWAINRLDGLDDLPILAGTKAGADYIGRELRINGERNSQLYVTKPSFASGGVAFYGAPPYSPELEEAKTFYNHIINGTPLCVLPQQAAVVTLILETIYKSARENRPITLDV
ncbi:MAG: Gfo/Idh/MocA family oxidoreductase [Clostridia bacterium]|nr:Gfo/Idh/MocA family oxidoreductase [Clostridia bacterium]